ncbi:hypothetical protein [Nocardiopsis sp. NRRL B-16309]|uniref:hypothetical protein n=1 Tax=Nocardiopsis sp. NRRL B-16309 TaxID=1519494 RepID=UPI0006ADD82A|nr:hypothetical protein [Nocardiopsis sp. NRRL B-16309]
MDGIGFVLPLWIGQARRSGLFPTIRAHLLFSVLAEAADVDGRWCFLYQRTVSARSGGLLSESTVLRALQDLKTARLVHVLSREETRAFFAADLASGARHADRLPLVIDLLIPAGAYPAQTLAEINRARARLGEELLDEATRPYPAVGTTRQPDTREASERRTDLSPKHPSHHRADASVRRRVSTGGDEHARTTAHNDIPESSTYAAAPAPALPPRPATPSPPLPTPLPRLSERLAAAVPTHRLTRPHHDRRALAEAAGLLLDQGLSEHDVSTLFTGTDALDRPFPALMRRLRTLRDARAFLTGRLSRSSATEPGTDRAHPGTVPDLAEADPFSRHPSFDVDDRGAAARTCPRHPGVRNAPGAACRVCGDPCRAVPGELLHPPAQDSTDPALWKRVLDSYARAGRPRREEPAGPAHPPGRQRIITQLRQQLTASPATPPDSRARPARSAPQRQRQSMRPATLR